MCPHTYIEIHVIGNQTLLACADCLVVLEHDIPAFVKR